VEWSLKNEVVFGSKKRVSFYDISSKVVKNQDIGFMPCSLQHSGGYLAISGSGGCTLNSTDATEIAKIAGEYIWSSCCSPCGEILAVGTEVGSVIVYSIGYSKNPLLAIELFIRLNRWDQARQLAENTGCVDTRTLAKRQAKCALLSNDVNLAKSAYLESHDHVSAIELVGIHREKYDKWENEILEIVRISDRRKEVLSAASEMFARAGAYHHLVQLYNLTKDYNKLLQLHIEHQNWKEADKILDEQKDLLDGGGSLARAQILVMQGQFRKAFEFYLQAGRFDMARKIMIELSNKAAEMNEYNNASHYLWILAKALRERTVFLTDDVFDLIKRSECYYIYHRVFISCTQPFSTIHPESVLNAAALVYNCIPDEHCGFIGISMPKVLSTLAKQASVLDANLTVKLCFDKLKERKIPPPFPQMKGESSDFNVSIETLLGYPILPF
jgi:tetratricopeptide (TPR) repeat protein